MNDLQAEVNDLTSLTFVLVDEQASQAEAIKAIMRSLRQIEATLARVAPRSEAS